MNQHNPYGDHTHEPKQRDATRDKTIPPPRNKPDENPILFESQHVNSIAFLDALDDTTRVITTSVETAAIDLRTGAKQFTTRSSLAIGVEGSITTPDRLSPCRGCQNGYRYTTAAMTTCADCGIALGIPCCAKRQREPRCKPCQRTHFWKTLWDTITTLHKQNS